MEAPEVVVAGHICLDIIPGMEARDQGMDAIVAPGKLRNIGPALLVTGGAVSNTGIALHRLGVRTRLMGKIGNDLFGHAILDIVSGYGESLAEGMILAEGESSSYTIVLSPPGIDRMFLHCPGANDTFTADDLRPNAVGQATLFHFGYPPLMRRMYENDGSELVKLLEQAKSEGAAVSLDLARPDPESDAGRANWPSILRRALPSVDLFFPSFEEILYLLRREKYDLLEREHGAGSLLHCADGALLRSLGEELLGMGAAIVVIKLGEYGLYLRTTPDPERLTRMGRYDLNQVEEWRSRELVATSYQVEVAGTTGAGDSTIAGFLTGMLQGGTPEEVLDLATAVGACNVERADALSGVPTLADVRQRMNAGWLRRGNKLELSGWRSVGNGIWTGPADRNPIVYGGETL